MEQQRRERPVVPATATTTFVALPEDLDRAYALYRERVAASPFEILAVSPRPVAAHSSYMLWDLRSEAVVYRLKRPEEMLLYRLSALVAFPEKLETRADRYAFQDDDANNEKFFFEDHDAPTVFPGTLSGFGELEPGAALARLEPDALPLSEGVKWYNAVFFGRPDDPDVFTVAGQLFADWCAAVGPLAHDPGIFEPDQTDDEVVSASGPLLLRDTELHYLGAQGASDDCYPGAKTTWIGRLLTDKPAADVEAALGETLPPEPMVLTRVVAEEF